MKHVFTLFMVAIFFGFVFFISTALFDYAAHLQGYYTQGLQESQSWQD